MSDLIFIPPAASSKPARDIKTALFPEKTTKFGASNFDLFLKEADERRFQADQSWKKGEGFGPDQARGKTGSNKDELKTVNADQVGRDEPGPQSKPDQDAVSGGGTKEVSQVTETGEEKSPEKVSDETDHQDENEGKVNQDQSLALMVQSVDEIVIQDEIQLETVLSDENSHIVAGVGQVKTVQTVPVLAGDESGEVKPGEGGETLPLKVGTVKANPETSTDQEQVHQVLTTVSTDVNLSQTEDGSLADQGHNPDKNPQVAVLIKNVNVEVVNEDEGQNFGEMVSTENAQSLKTETEAPPLDGQASNHVKEGKVNLAVIQTQLAVNDASEVKAEPQVLSVAPTQPAVTNGPSGQVFAPSEIIAMNKEELFTQIVEQAKVIVNNGGSEMEVNLKPEHLGKLQLKVTIENDVVTAKFVAESQQVKEIIESNLSQLKRDLQTNGMQVDTILVSVGNQQGNEGFGQASYNGDRTSNFSSTGNNVADEAVIETEYPEADIKGEGVIDLIA